MSKIYELDMSLFKKIKMYPTNDKFIFINGKNRTVVTVDNSCGKFFKEEFSNKTKALIYLVNEKYKVSDVEEEYLQNKDKYDYTKYKKVVSDSCDYYTDRNLKDRDFLKFNLNKKYIFKINMGFKDYQLKSTIKVALGLALNYCSDLSYNDTLIISPTDFDWEENHKFIEKCIGCENLSSCRDKNMFGWFIPYIRVDSPKIEWIEEEKNKNIKI